MSQKPPPSETSGLERPPLPSGFVVFVKRDCPTCELVVPILAALSEEVPLTVYTQDDPAFPSGLEAIDDTDLTLSWHYEIEAVPTLLRVESGREVERVLGWHRGEWETLTGVGELGPGLPDFRPGCGSLSVDPVRGPELAIRFGLSKLRSRRVEIATLEDEMQACFDRGWTDGFVSPPPGFPPPGFPPPGNPPGFPPPGNPPGAPPRP